MRVRTTLAPALLCAGALIALLSPGPAFAQMRMPLDDLERGLRAAETGAELPPSNRPLPQALSINEKKLDRQAGEVAPAPFVAPAEFGVILEYEGGRAALEASGVRVVSQVGSIYTARMRR